jgi:hypothetical protein
MSSNGRAITPPDLSAYEQNRSRFPQQELVKYAGQYVAFSPDGTRILASGVDMDEVEHKLVAAGHDPSQVVGSFIPPQAAVIL